MFLLPFTFDQLNASKVFQKKKKITDHKLGTVVSTYLFCW